MEVDEEMRRSMDEGRVVSGWHSASRTGRVRAKGKVKERCRKGKVVGRRGCKSDGMVGLGKGQSCKWQGEEDSCK